MAKVSFVLCRCGKSAHLEWRGGRTEEFATQSDGRREIEDLRLSKQIGAKEFEDLLRQLDQTALPQNDLEIPRDAFCELVRPRRSG